MVKTSENRLKKLRKKFKPKLKKFVSILLGVVFFLLLIGSAFSISKLFGVAFVIAFALAIYNGELKYKPWKPIAVFVGALIVRVALDQYFDPLVKAETIMDLSVSALIFFAILVFGWKIKKG